MRIELLIIGDELLTGGTDPYPAAIVSAIKGKGAYVSRITVVPDELDEIVPELQSAQTRGVELLLVTGGLGPTLDDVTRHALAKFLGRPLKIDQEAVGWMDEAIMRFHGKRPASSDERLLMAKVPEGAKALRNPNGVASGIEAEADGMKIFCVPGFPREMQAMFEAYILPLVRSEGLYEKELWVMRRETTMEPLFQRIVSEFKVKVASLPKDTWRQTGNQVIIKGQRDEVERALKVFLEMVERTPDRYEE